ncbi:hypothetical protein [Biformimicrobium ophioploci]|uniref:Uncharacterized protein n=1 Tax=Biformimicrobium ophioploci TaxID=3036711 RepID=A0ABQ6M149_9GAMM|nr:hypothetical protein [Microbulbifer sp. NKW57]GMG88089.1 hypothetical protein MNKW57_24100 [Microbulbifer sp. NKW57]
MRSELKFLQSARRHTLLLGIALCAAAPAFAQDKVVTMESTITGNVEQPKILYIVPWQKSTSLEKIPSSLAVTAEEVFGHQEYGEFQREVQYRTEITATAAQAVLNKDKDSAE